MENLIVAGIVLNILLLSLIFSKKNRSYPDKFLILYLTVATLAQVVLYFETMSFFQQSLLMLLGKGLYLLNAPLFFAYVYTLLTSKKISVRLSVVLFLPFAAYVLHFIYYYFFVFDEAELSIRSGMLLVNGKVAVSWQIFVIGFLLIEPAYLVWYLVLLRKHKKGLLHSSSVIDYHLLRWLYFLFYLWLTITAVLVPLSMLSVVTEILSHDLLQLMIQSATVLFFFIVGYYGFKRTTVFVDPEVKAVPDESPKNPLYQKSGLSEDQAAAYHQRLLTYMETEKPYLNGELKALELAQMIGISVNHLSQVLNQKQQQNFFDFVNGYRLKDVITKMKDPANSHLTLLAMALDSGFNSKTSFNTVFKKLTHQTPSAYYKAIKTGLKKNS